MLKVSDLKMLEVINVEDGKRLGEIKDIELDLQNGKIVSIVLPGGGRVFKIFGKGEDIVVPWDKILKLGVDVILVDLQNISTSKYEGYER